MNTNSKLESNSKPKFTRSLVKAATSIAAVCGLLSSWTPLGTAQAQVPAGCINGFQAAGIGVSPTTAHVGDTVTIVALGFGGAVGTSCELTQGQSFVMAPNGVTVQTYQNNFFQNTAGQLLTCLPVASGPNAGCVAINTAYVIQAADVNRPLSFTTPRGFSSGSVPGSPKTVKFLAVSDGFLTGSGGAQTGGGQGNTLVNIVTPGLTITKECVQNCPVPPGGTARIGDPINYRGTVCNTGDIRVVNITLADVPTGGVVPGSDTQAFAATTSTGRAYDGSLEPGECVNYTGSYRPAGSGAQLCGPFTDTITVTGVDTAPIPKTVTASATAVCTVCTAPCIEVIKDCIDTLVAAGMPIRYEFRVRNCGDVPLQNVVAVDDNATPSVPGDDITTPIGNLAVGETKGPFMGTFQTSVQDCAIGRTTYTNTVLARGQNLCPAPNLQEVMDSDDCVATVFCPPRICVTKEIACLVDPNTCGTFDTSATGIKVSTNLPAFCYRITVSNCGPVGLTNVMVIDDKFGNLTADFRPCIADVFSPGESCTFTFKTSLADDQTNTVTASGRSVANGQTTTAQDSATGHVFQASITCNKQVSTDGVNYTNSVVIPQDGQDHTVHYRITVSNTSESGVTLTNLHVTDPLLTGCNIAGQVPASLPSGNSFNVDCAVLLNCNNIPGGQLANTATVSGEVSSSGQTVCVHDLNGNPITVSSSCSALVTCEGCQLLVTKRCLVPPPPPQPFDCSGAKPITSMTVQWNGTPTIYVRAWNGSIGTGTPSLFGPVAPGQKVTFTRSTASTPNDIYFELFTDPSLSAASKLGNSTFHLSCSDSDMNGPEDCGKAAGDGKGQTGFINEWIFVGLAGNNRVLDCFPTTPPTLEATNTICDITPAQNLGCGGALGNATKPTSLTFRYTGGGCAAGNNPQSGKFTCSGQIDPTQPVTVTTANGYTISPSLVQPGAEFTVSAGSFNAQSDFTLSNSGGTEDLSIHTSCSQLLAVGDVFGSLTLVGFNGQTAGADIIYLYTVTNPSSQPVLGIVLTDDKLGPIAGPFDLAAGQSMSFQASAGISVTTTNVATASAGPGCEAQSNPVIVRVPEQPPTLPCPAEICSDFNDKPIAAGNYVWFNGVVKVEKRDGRPGTVTFTNQRIKFTSNGVNYDLPAPDTTIIFSATAAEASTVFDTVSNRWVTTVPVKYNGNVSIGGLAVPAPVGGFAKKIKPVCWSGSFGSDIGTVEFHWKWAAAVYSQFSTDYNALGVKPIDGDKLNPYKNSDHAGTPENFKGRVVAGARGGGGSNFTGSYSGSKTVVCPGEETPSPECTSAVVAFLVQYTGSDVAGPLTLKFTGSQSPSTIVATYVLPSGLTTGMVLSLPVESDPNRPWTIDATKHNQAKLGTKTEVYFNNVLTEIFHTSCSCNQNNFIPGQPACLDASSPDNPTGTKGEPSPLFRVLDFK